MKLLTRIFFTIYAVFGVLYLKWAIFPIIFLFWAETVIPLLFSWLSFKSTPKAYIAKITDEQGNETKQTQYQSIMVMLFFNALYFFFITFAYGFMALFDKSKETDKSFDVIGSIIFTLGGKNTSFNIALLLCVLREAWFYVRDCWVNKIYNEKNLFEANGFGYRELVLHISIIFGLGGSTLFSKWITENNTQDISSNETAIFLIKYGFILVFLALKLLAEFFVFFKEKPKPQIIKTQENNEIMP